MRSFADLTSRAPVSSPLRPPVQSPASRASLVCATCLGLAATGLVTGCASAIAAHPRETEPVVVAAQWHAPLPHDGHVADLADWWAQFDDSLLVRLIEASQRVSPTVAEAAARVADARAARVSARAVLMPTVDASAHSSRGQQAFGGAGPVASEMVSTASVQASWEVDVFAAGRAGANAAHARLESSHAEWHDARVSVAAEVATSYVELRACEAQVRQAEFDAASRAQTSQLTSQAAKAGIQAPAAADQAAASAAQSTVALIEQRTQCDLLIKSVTALAAQDEEALRRDLGPGAGRLPRPAALRITSVPAEVLAQRPDIYAAALNVVAASRDSTQARARQWPRISLGGNIGTTRIAFGSETMTGIVWSLGPVTVTLPLFDGGTRRANAAAARVRYEAATAIYAARLRDGIRDVERALVTLESTAQRTEAALIAANGFERSFRATDASYRAGLANLFDLEDARRNMVAAQSAVIDLQRERVAGWIALYRALGGGWSPASIDRAIPNPVQR